MEYLTFSRYKELGGTLPEATFNSLYRKTKNKVDYYSFDRFKKATTIPKELEDCLMDLIEKTEFFETLCKPDNGNVASESANGYSISYGNNNSAFFTNNNESESVVLDTIKMYLVNVKTSEGIPVLYRGV